LAGTIVDIVNNCLRVFCVMTTLYRRQPFMIVSDDYRSVCNFSLMICIYAKSDLCNHVCFVV